MRHVPLSGFPLLGAIHVLHCARVPFLNHDVAHLLTSDQVLVNVCATPDGP